MHAYIHLNIYPLLPREHCMWHVITLQTNGYVLCEPVSSIPTSLSFFKFLPLCMYCVCTNIHTNQYCMYMYIIICIACTCIIIMCMHIHEPGSLSELLVYSLEPSCLFWQCTMPKYRLQIHPLTLYLIESLETGVEVGQTGLPDTSLVLKPFEVWRVLETL